MRAPLLVLYIHHPLDHLLQPVSGFLPLLPIEYMAQREEVSVERRFLGVEEVFHPRQGVVKEVVLSIGLDGDEVLDQTHVINLERLVGGSRFVNHELEAFIDRGYVRHVASFGFGKLGAVTEDDVSGRAETKRARVVQDFDLMSRRTRDEEEMHERGESTKKVMAVAHQRIHNELPVRSRRRHRIIAPDDISLPELFIEFAREERVQEITRIHRSQHRGCKVFDEGPGPWVHQRRFWLKEIVSLDHQAVMVDVASAGGGLVEPGVRHGSVGGGKLEGRV